MPQIKDIGITKTTAEDIDFLIMQSPNGETYNITKANLLKGLAGGTIAVNPDTLFSSVILLLSNDNTVFLDKSSLVNSLSTTGTVIETFSKFSANSAYFAGTNIISVPNRSQFDLGNSDFTAEALVYPKLLDSGNRYIISKVGDLSNNYNRSYGLNVSANNFQWYWSENGGNDNSINFPSILAINNWYHIAVSRKNNVLYGFLNGALISSSPHTPSYFIGSAGITIGSFGGYGTQGYPQLSYIGNIEKNGLRLTKSCRYTESFTPPTSAFTGN